MEIEIKWKISKNGNGRSWAYSYCEVCKEWIMASRSNRHKTKNPKHLRLSRPEPMRNLEEIKSGCKE